MKTIKDVRANRQVLENRVEAIENPAQALEETMVMFAEAVRM